MNKIIGIHQPNFMPWPGYFNKIFQSDVFVILDNVDYQSGNANSITNRTKIKTAQGELFISVPVKKSDGTRLIKDVLIDNQQPWQRKMVKTIQMNYARAKYFKEVFPEIEQLLIAAHDKLSDLNCDVIYYCCRKLGINKAMIKASEMNLNSDEKNNRIIEICKCLDANIYLSGSGGKKYNDAALFTDNQINITYTGFSAVEYQQLHGPFIGGLSILDTAMNIGWEAAARMVCK